MYACSRKFNNGSEQLVTVVENRRKKKLGNRRRIRCITPSEYEMAYRNDTFPIFQLFLESVGLNYRDICLGAIGEIVLGWHGIC